MTSSYDLSVATELLTGMRAARGAIGRGELVVMPTDTVYGLAADAFDSSAVQALLDAKGRGRQSPPPVLVKGLDTLAALTESVPDLVRPLLDEFWPGPLTVIFRAQPSLSWDLGETRGTVALRMPSHPMALELLEETGPLAVSSANLTGQPAAATVDDARAMLADRVAVYLDAGPVGESYERRPGANTGSTIVDATGAADGVLRIVRHGVLPDSEIRRVVGDAAVA
ncbi:threonylcarbamoyl-AMP synthase [Frigoribacterium sp. CFBP 8754]|jgi:tRNA threonylcarbamoyl adenosine modification protein (Sua5/YciO/YrdC/YwlC family)|uniref:L-threonylcarbamoyladenylate synthase n=1 Tax=unclassified Frigoribacterium TaxID=2627005 RepID=UPI0006F73BC6|nr:MULTISPECIES: L-threonylcarbamoyladenylate synthase [unclassified Frigoribacterium]KQR46704.1 translation factor SUA5 [Frigoribacterium sp. Leaf164]MBD8659237.1 threonylcarbamoyl-AMP synthase [Frigoribacterium sp. CFBP 8754]MBD8727531.1 threonylcarbamoyl-AMP synthase [Frigoribacterium sp. CFBP 13707]QNE45020.1 threonylcarbamoyl-AMP synthase [Frigoribacterium sp. NBH87]